MRSFKRLIVPLLFFSLAAYALHSSIIHPHHGWDMIAYVAAAKSFEEHDVDSLHSFTYNQVRSSTSTEHYKELVSGQFRNTISNDPTALTELLPFYHIRPLFVGLIYLLYKSGVNIVFATHLISGVSVFIAVIFLYLLSVSLLPKSLTYVIPLLAFIYGVVGLAQTSFPDGLAFLAIVLSAYLYLKKRTLLLLIFLPIILGIRTDLILFTIPLMSFILFLEKDYRQKAMLSIFLSIAVFISIGIYANNPGWTTVFHHSFVKLSTHPISNQPALTIGQYFSALSRGTGNLVNNNPFILYLVIAVYSLHLFKVGTKTKSLITALNSRSTVLSLVCIFYVATHILIFPAAYLRFFSAPYLIGSLALLVMITESNITQQDSS